MRYLGNGIGHRSTNHIQFNDINAGPGLSIRNSSAKLGEVDSDEISQSDHDVDVARDELDGFSDGNDRESEEMISDEDDDYGYNHNRLIHEDDDTGEIEEEDDCESMYMD